MIAVEKRFKSFNQKSNSNLYVRDIIQVKLRQPTNEEYFDPLALKSNDIKIQDDQRFEPLLGNSEYLKLMKSREWKMPLQYLVLTLVKIQEPPCL